MNREIKELSRKNALFHFSIDGLIEIAAGIILLDAGLGYLHFRLTENHYSNPTIYISITPVTLFVLLALVIMKRTAVYNRIGYMKLHADSLKIATWITGSLAALLILIILPGQVEKLAGAEVSLLVKNSEIHLFWLCSSLLFFYSGWKYSIGRFYIYGALLILAPAAYLHLSSLYAVSSALLISGLTVSISGVITFLKFLKKYPRQEAG